MKNSECHGKARTAFHHTLFLICVFLGFVSLNATRPATADEGDTAAAWNAPSTDSNENHPYTAYRLFGGQSKNTNALSDSSLAGKVVLLDFYSDYCGPCRSMMPVVDRLRARGYAIRKINTSREVALAQKMHVNQIPCFVVMVDGKEYTRCVGTTSERNLEQMIVQASKQIVPTERLVQNTDTCDVQKTAALENQRSAWRGREVNVTVNEIVRRPQIFPVTDQSMANLRLATNSNAPNVQSNVASQSNQQVNPPQFIPANVPAMQASMNQAVASDASAFAANGTPAQQATAPNGMMANNAEFPQQTINTPVPATSNPTPATASNSVLVPVPAPAVATPLQNSMQAPASELHQKALASSVRINILGEKTQDCGTGTIIDARSGRALVLTCGHLFRDYQAGSRITVDFFGENGLRSVEARYIGHDLESDLGLLSVPVERPVIVTPIAPKNYALTKGMAICTSGCSHGADPTIQTGSVTQIGRYLGPANIEVSAVPVQGRSGGGLFTNDLHLIGVCVAADAEYQEGMFTSVPAIHEYLEKMQLAQIACNPRNESLSLITNTAPTVAQAQNIAPESMAGTAEADDEAIMLLTDLQMKNAPAQSAAAQTAPMQAAQAPNFPTETASVSSFPAPNFPAQSAQVQATPAPAAPMQAAQTQAAPVQVAPMQAIPAQPIPAQNVPSEFPETQSVPARNVSQPADAPRVISIDGRDITPDSTGAPSTAETYAAAGQSSNAPSQSLTGEPAPAWPPQWK